MRGIFVFENGQSLLSPAAGQLVIHSNHHLYIDILQNSTVILILPRLETSLPNIYHPDHPSTLLYSTRSSSIQKTLSYLLHLHSPGLCTTRSYQSHYPGRNLVMPKVMSTYVGKGGGLIRVYFRLPCTVDVHGNSGVVDVATSEGLCDYLVGEEVLRAEGPTLGQVTEAWGLSKANRSLIRIRIYLSPGISKKICRRGSMIHSSFCGERHAHLGGS